MVVRQPRFSVFVLLLCVLLAGPATVAVASSTSSTTAVAGEQVTAPSPPQDLEVTTNVGQWVERPTVWATWWPPLDDGGSPLTHYEAWISGPGAPSEPRVKPVDGWLPIMVSWDGLVNGATYTVRVRAVNAAGASATVEHPPVTPVNAPGAPRDLTARMVDPQLLELTWAVPAYDGGSPLAEFVVGGVAIGEVARLDATARSVRIPLDLGQSYGFYVSAVNEAGYSDYAWARPVTAPWQMTVSRVAGGDRYETAARVTADFRSGQPVVYIASGADYPDALGGAALAGSRNAPLLLTRPTGLPSSVRAELDRLRPRKVVVLGGTLAVNDDVLKALRQYTTDGSAESVERWSAPDRYALSARISQQFGSGHETVYVAAGTNFPDALAGAALAGRDKAPILLVRPTSIPGAVADQLALLGARRIVVIGGPAAVNEQVLIELKQYATADTSDEVRRIGGADRYAVAANVAREFQAEQPRSYVANGQDFPDALAAASAAARGGFPVILTRPDRLTTPATAALGHVRTRDLTIVGGQKAVSSLAEEALKDLIIYPLHPINPEPGP